MIGKYLKSEGFNLRERLNIYTSMALGPVIGTGLMYTIIETCTQGESNSFGAYAAKICLATAMNIPFIVPEIFGGLGVGSIEARRLKNQRREKPTKFDKKINQEFATSKENTA